MKIGMLLEAPFPPDLRVENEMQTLVAAGHEIVLFCLKHDKDQPDEQFDDKIFLCRKYLSRKVFNKIRTTVLRFPFYALLWTRFVSEYNSLDAIHVHDLPLARVGQKLARKSGIPFILDLHENYPAAIQTWGHNRRSLGRYLYRYPAWVKYEQRAVSAADYVIVVIEEAKERLVNAGIAAEKIVVVPNTLNLNSPELNVAVAGQKADKEFIITYVGGFGEHRGLQVAIEAMPDILKQGQNIKLVLIGEGSNRQSLERLTADLKVTKNVVFTGWLDLNQALLRVMQSDVCIIPYLSNEHTETTIPHKLFQYIYFKKPIVVSDCAPLKRIVTETESGSIFKSGDAAGFARAIISLYRDKNLRIQMGDKGRSAVLNKYNWQKTSSGLARLYKKIS